MVGTTATPDADPQKSTRRERATRRLLNLLFTLNAASGPVATEDILENPEIGYEGATREARDRAFLRDRRTLAEHGVFIHAASAGGEAKNEQRMWEIDRAQTHALPNLISRYDAEAVLAAIDQTFELHASDPSSWALQTARAKLCSAAGIENGQPENPLPPSADLRALWSAFDRRRIVEFTYRNARGEKRPRKVEIYGMFMRGSHVYLVGRDSSIDAVRTFRTDRILKVKPAPDSASSYSIPAAFDVGGFQFLPFDFSDQDPVPAVFSFDGALGHDELALITQGRGTLEQREDGTWLWSVDVRDLDAAAGFALSHASRGMRAVSPNSLCDRVRMHIEQAVSVHAQQG